MNRKILLWGGRSKARIIEAMLNELDLGAVEIIFDQTLSDLSFYTEAKLVTGLDELRKCIDNLTHYVVCVGAEHGYARYSIAIYLEKLGLKPISLIHQSSFIDPSSSIGDGCQIMPRAVVHKFTEIGAQSIINTNATVDHECRIGKGVHIMGAAAVTGKVEIGDFATIGTNATIFPFVKIGEGAFIGAGSLVKEDIAPYTVNIGAPSRVLRTVERKYSKDFFLQLD